MLPSQTVWERPVEPGEAINAVTAMRQPSMHSHTYTQCHTSYIHLIITLEKQDEGGVALPLASKQHIRYLALTYTDSPPSHATVLPQLPVPRFSGLAESEVV